MFQKGHFAFNHVISFFLLFSTRMQRFINLSIFRNLYKTFAKRFIRLSILGLFKCFSLVQYSIL